LVLTADKRYLVDSRLKPIAREHGLADVDAVLAQLRARPSSELARQCVDAMATHETFFFRDGTPFNLFEKRVLPALISARQSTRALRIWCAACSSGQEPYSLAILLQEAAARLSGWRLEIVATDMSEGILGKARSGVYSSFEVKRGLSEDRLKRWFTPEGPNWRVSPALQQMVTFKPHNLLAGAAGLGAFDVIFCRNVLIYFDVAQKRTILQQLSRVLNRDGALFLGSAETVLGVTDAFELTPGASGLFQLSQSTPARQQA
jgi:chemotaxis protein methyltransferase CheR